MPILSTGIKQIDGNINRVETVLLTVVALRTIVLTTFIISAQSYQHGLCNMTIQLTLLYIRHRKSMPLSCKAHGADTMTDH